MDFSKLGQNERLAAMASAVLVITGLFAAASYRTYSVTWLAVIAALAMLFVVFQPQIASGVNLPGSKGSLMLVLGVVAGAIMVLSLLLTFSFVFSLFGLPDVFYLIAVGAGVAMAWAGWQEFQAQGGKFQLGAGTPSPASAGSAAAPAPAAAPIATEPAPAPAPADDAAAESFAPSAADDADEDRPREA
jgi:hypothetical protein